MRCAVSDEDRIREKQVAKHKAEIAEFETYHYPFYRSLQEIECHIPEHGKHEYYRYDLCDSGAFGENKLLNMTDCIIVGQIDRIHGYCGRYVHVDESRVD